MKNTGDKVRSRKPAWLIAAFYASPAWLYLYVTEFGPYSDLDMEFIGYFLVYLPHLPGVMVGMLLSPLIGDQEPGLVMAFVINILYYYLVSLFFVTQFRKLERNRTRSRKEP